MSPRFLSMSPNIFSPALRSHGLPVQCGMCVTIIIPNLGDGEQSGSSAKAVIAIHPMRFDLWTRWGIDKAAKQCI
jgi:hypothetical protein